MNKTLRNTIIIVGVIAVLVLIISILPTENFHDKYDGFDLSVSTSAGSRKDTYNEYLTRFKAKYPTKEVSVDLFSYDEDESTKVYVEQGYQGAERVLVTEDGSSVTWTVDVPEEGFYNIQLDFVAMPSRNVDMERIVKINGEVPFTGADILTFQRVWKDGGVIREDNRGNQIRPAQVESFDWQKDYLKSDSGYEVEPYKFYFRKGESTITLEATNEPMAISAVTLTPVRKIRTYSEYLANQKSKSDSFTANVEQIKVQGEAAIRRSSPSLFARSDRSSPITEPYSVSKNILNYIGGDSWKNPGQWIEWEIDVAQDGWYKISIEGRQSYSHGFVSCRSLYIDGEIPFDGVQALGFAYTNDWKLLTLADENKEPYNFYLSKGKHKIRLEATLGDVASIISELEDCVFRLNIMYRTILVLTGTTPDPIRDYEIHKVYPNEYEAMNIESKRLYSLVDKYVEITGEKSDSIAPAQTLAVQLEEFYRRPDRITKDFTSFKSNITSLGSSLLTLAETKLDIDYLLLTGKNDKVVAQKSNGFKRAKHEIVSFLTSFFVDSASLGDVYNDNDEHLIEVWVLAARDQSMLLKNIVDDSFTPNTGIRVNVKVIDVNALLPATTAGNGPDVVVSLYETAPVDYALRSASVNLRQFPDCEEVLKQFKHSSYVAYEYDGGLYALPEQTSFNLMFYRTDIFEQLEIEPPDTWDDLIAILPTLQGNNLQVAIPFPQVNGNDIGGFYTMVFQNGGEVYNSRGTKTALDNEEGISAFKTFTSLFNSYGLETYYDFPSRFRTGDMPLGIANYTTYNTLAVSAPEIRGLWDFAYLPGTVRTDKNGNEYVDRSVGLGGVACMMINKAGVEIDDTDAISSFFGISTETNKEQILLEKSKKQKRNIMRQSDSWEFMKWWVSTETQVRYGREIEALLGASARYATANVEALKQLSWKSSQLQIITDSLDESVGVPNVPGSYYTNRHVVNGIRKVITEQDDPRETLIDYARKINDELTRKRQEFNLPVED